MKISYTMNTFGMLSIASILCSWIANPVMGQTFTVEQQNLNNAKSLWQSQGIKNYDFMYREFGSNPHNFAYPFTTQVRNGITGSFKDGNGKDITSVKPATLDCYFDLIQDQINAPARQVSVQYSDKGYPDRMYIVRGDGSIYDAQIFGFTETTRRALSTPNFQATQADLNKNKALWQHHGLKNYDFKFSESGSNPHNYAYPFTTQVRNGAAVSFKDANGADVTSLSPATLDSYFNLIQDQINAPARQINVQYNAGLGYVTEMYIVRSDGSIYNAQITGFTSQRRLRGSKQVNED